MSIVSLFDSEKTEHSVSFELGLVADQSQLELHLKMLNSFANWQEYTKQINRIKLGYLRSEKFQINAKRERI